MKCPHCGLFSPDIAERCDCGYDFAAGQMKVSYLPTPRRDSPGLLEPIVFVGLFVAVMIGLLGSVIMAVAEESTRYRFWGFVGVYGISSGMGLVSLLFARQKMVALAVYGGLVVGLLGGALLAAMLVAPGAIDSGFPLRLSLAIPPISGAAAAGLTLKYLASASNRRRRETE
jgi:hypothetical protein